MPKTILVADDSRTIQEVVRLALQGEGYELLVCGSGATALQQAREHRPGLVLADLRMPDGDGSWLVRQLRGDPQLSATPAVLLYPGTDPAPEVLRREIGASALLAKPFLAGELAELCRQLLQSGAAREPRPAEPPAVPGPGQTRTATPSLAERISRMEEVLGRRGGPTGNETIAFAAKGGAPAGGRSGTPESGPPAEEQAMLDALRQAGRAFQRAKVPPAAPPARPPVAAPGPVPSTPSRATLPAVDPGAGKTQAFRSFTPPRIGVLESPPTPGPLAPAPFGPPPARAPLPTPLTTARPAPAVPPRATDVPPSAAARPSQAAAAEPALPRAAAAPESGPRRPLTRDDLLEAVRQVAKEAVERAIWELVPDIAEKLLWEMLPEITETLVREQLEAQRQRKP